MGGVRNVFWNEVEGRLRALWRVLILLVIWFVGFVAVSVAASALSSGGSVVVFNLVIFLAGGAWTVVLVLISTRFLDHRSLADFGFHFGKRWWKDFGAEVIILLLAYGGFFVYGLVTGLYEVTGFPTSGGAPFLLALSVVALANLSQTSIEEVVFRGHLLRNTAEGLRSPRVSAVVALFGGFLISGVAFSLLHLGQDGSFLYLIVYHLISAAWFTAAFLLTGSLALPIGLHFANNFFIASLASGAGEGPAIFEVPSQLPEWYGFFLEIAYKLVALLLVLLYVRWSRGELRLHTQLAEYEPPAKTSGQDTARLVTS